MEYFEDGKPQKEINFKDGEKHGIVRCYCGEDGKLHQDSIYDEGKLTGKRTTYYPDGNLLEITEWKDDEL